MSSAPSAAVLAQVQTAIATCPAGANVYTCLRESLQRQLQVLPPPWVARALLGCSVLTGCLGVWSAVILILRLRAGNFWLFRVTDSPIGSVIIPHIMNAYLIYAGVAQGAIWSLHRLTLGDLSALGSAMLWSALVYTPLIIAVWSDLLVVLNANLADRIKWAHAHRILRPLFILVSIYPIIHVLAIAGLSVPLYRLGLRPLVDQAVQLLGLFAALEPTWTGTINYAALLPLTPIAEALLAASAQYSKWMSAIFGVWSFTVTLFWLIWVPASILHLRSFYAQIRMLRGTVRVLSQHRRTSEYVDAEESRSGKVVAKADSAERRIRFLLNMCWSRIIALVFLTLALSVFVTVALLVAIDPLAVTVDPERAAYCAVATYISAAVAAAPLLVISSMSVNSDAKSRAATGASVDQSMRELSQASRKHAPTLSKSDLATTPDTEAAHDELKVVLDAPSLSGPALLKP